MLYRSIEELKKRSVCLIAKPNTNVPNCHENDYCKCDINVLLEKIKALEIETDRLSLLQKAFISEYNLKLTDIAAIVKRYRKKNGN